MSSAVGYTRISQESDTSIDRQKHHIRTYADENGLKLEAIYDDGEHSSGFDESREEYQRVRERVQSGGIAAVIVNDKRRLARDFDETMRLVLDLREHDVEAHTFQEGRLDLSDPVQAAVEVLQAASEHEAKKKEIERAREAVQERIENGYDHGRPPIGFQFDDAGERWVPDREGRFEHVVEAIRMVEDGATYRDVQEELDIAPSTMSGVMDRRDRYLQETESP
ncbi:recombinase family protein [Halomicroarcula sp. F13]|uniref:Recombinase family protein n=1 Tax=Haloarcula rubra TaxID=2487747 RepID=A0AAW4PP31_9EURY|nr:recombinase family protein [Halomicroarcula rubra]MBX0322930.1 recombinase family protein [Halomicroarcula rubra]QIO21737.1 recombinase family protein [Haloarcula sp. JP-L23]